ncbi:hypothetical protein JCM17845_15370 [Iodidimonas gelatinilytica]|uniref:SF3 helicase domain-containing protein n=1 Tax=Iodidimonas gelatinilytica TaxID=1236966 RepID=A0A5A7MZS7_9PROT|nr:phage/plasmid primase, P4 family [Iodidimonas gelatinilytica]GER00914.1 hypothetical protein JCM17845_15370 [Iodidimonas gelatinilytica]
MSDFFQKMIGYAFSGHVSEQCFFMLQGPGQDGKSTTMNIIRRVMGGYAAVADVKTFLDLGQRSGADASPDLARLSGDVRLVSCSEPPRGAKLNEALLKGITGGAPITARHLNRDPFEYSPRFKIVMEVNDRPRVMGGDEGIWRRIVPIPFSRKIPDNEIDRTLEDRLVQTEGPGILNWALEGLAMWMAEGLGRPEAVREAVADYRAASNPFSEWFYDRCERDERAEESAADLYRDYQAWCEAGNYEPISNTAFGRALGDRQVNRRKGAGGRIFRRGVRLKPRDFEPAAGSSAPPPTAPPVQGSMMGGDYDPYAS